MKTESFWLTVGVTPGYYHENECADLAASIGARWQRLMEEGGAPFVPAVVSNGLAVYHRAWGCPEGGERVVMISGTRNPEFDRDPAEWRRAVLVMADKLQRELDQTTVQVEFRDVDMVYLTTSK